MKYQEKQSRRLIKRTYLEIPSNAFPFKDKKLNIYHYIKSNKAKCAKCGDVIISKHVHDYVPCSCGAIAVDGGNEYLKRVGNMDDVIELSEYGTASANEFKRWKKKHDLIIEHYRQKVKDEIDKIILSRLLYKDTFK